MKSGPAGSSPSSSKSLQQRQLLQHHRALAPDAGLADGVAAIVVGRRRFHGRLPARHVVGGEHAAMRRAADIHHFLGAAELVDRFGHKTLRPRLSRALDLGDAVAARALGFVQDAGVGFRERLVGEDRAGSAAPRRSADRPRPKWSSGFGIVFRRLEWSRPHALPADSRWRHRISPAPARRAAASCRSRAAAASRIRTCRERRPPAARCRAPSRALRSCNAQSSPWPAPDPGRRSLRCGRV